MQVARRFRGIVAVALFFLTIASTATAKYSGGTGEPNDPYQIATAADLIALGETPGDYDKHFILVADIDLDPKLPSRKVFDRAVIAPDTNDAEDWFHGTAFTGVLNGNGHIVSHLTIKGAKYLGLFGRIGDLDGSGEVKNLGVVDVNIIALGSCVAGLVAENCGSVTRCYSTGAVSGTGPYVGGLMGGNGGTVTQCYSTASVSGKEIVGGLVGRNSYCASLTQCYSAGSVIGNDDVGGLAGTNGGNISNCYCTARVSADYWVGGLVGSNELCESSCTGGRISNCYSVGPVRGSWPIGGLVGRKYSYSFIVPRWE